MSNFLLKNPDCVFIHIPKTGGSSIRHGIWKSNYVGPEFGSLPAGWMHLFKFAFVRHPLDRLISTWCDFTQLRNFNGTLDYFIEIVINNKIIYDERLTTIEEHIRHHTIPQTHPFNCLSYADYVGKFETYDNDLKKILASLKMETAILPHIRQTTHQQWNMYIKGRNLQKLLKFYESDFELLNYPPPHLTN